MEHRAMRLALPQTPRGSPMGGFGAVGPQILNPSFAVGGSSSSASNLVDSARGLFMPVARPPGGFEVRYDPDSPCEKTCDAFEACCKKRAPRNPNEPRWAYVGEGRGGYDKVMHLNYVGEGCGNYDDQYKQSSGKARAVCTGFLVCLAFLIGLSFALHRCSGADDDGFLCNNGAEDALEAAVREAAMRWAQLSPQEYCSHSSMPEDERKEAFCCEASRALCRTYMTAKVQGRDVDGQQAGYSAHAGGRKSALSGSKVVTEAPTASSTAPSTLSATTQQAMRLRRQPRTPLPTPPPRLPYDCNLDFATWAASWEEKKKEWCCQHALKGCSDGPPMAAATTTRGASVLMSTAAPSIPGELSPPRAATAAMGSAEAPVFNCLEGSEEAWSLPRKAWCCVHTSTGCPPAAAPKAVDVNVQGSVSATAKTASA